MGITAFKDFLKSIEFEIGILNNAVILEEVHQLVNR